MKLLTASAFFLLAAGAAIAQDAAPAANSIVVPVVRFTTPIPVAEPSVQVSVALYSEQSGGEALWMERQQIAPDASGKTELLIGAGTQGGIPAAVFAKGEARFVGIRVNNGAEQPRTLLAPSAYAFKAEDAETLAGHPLSDFKLTKNAVPNTVDVTSITAGTGITVTGNGSASPTVALNGPYFVTLASHYAALTANNTFTGANKFGPTTLGNTTINGTLNVSGTINSAFLNSIAATLPTLSGNNTLTGNNTFTKSLTVAVPTFTPPAGTTTSAIFATNGAAENGGQNSGVYGTGGDFGVVGTSPGIGVTGQSAATGGLFTGALGVEGLASAVAVPMGISGVVADYSVTGGNYPYGAGVWGDMEDNAAAYCCGSGMLATADGLTALWAENSGGGATIVAQNDSTLSGETVLQTQSTLSTNVCFIDNEANLFCNGSIGMVVPVHGGAAEVYAVHSPENWFEDFGTGTLSNGAAHISLEGAFADTVNPADYHVFLTPRGESESLYVANATAEGFDVLESHHGTSSVGFDYRIVARRKGYENIRLADMTARVLAHQRTMEARKKAMLEHPRKPILHGPQPAPVMVRPTNVGSPLSKSAGATAETQKTLAEVR